jgi:hypothetical protein
MEATMGVRFQRLMIRDVKVIRIGDVFLWEEDGCGMVLAPCGSMTRYRAEDGISGLELAIRGAIYSRMRESFVGMNTAGEYAKRRAARFMKRLKELDWL